MVHNPTSRSILWKPQKMVSKIFGGFKAVDTMTRNATKSQHNRTKPREDFRRETASESSNGLLHREKKAAEEKELRNQVPETLVVAADEPVQYVNTTFAPLFEPGGSKQSAISLDGSFTEAESPSGASRRHNAQQVKEFRTVEKQTGVSKARRQRRSATTPGPNASQRKPSLAVCSQHLSKRPIALDLSQDPISEDGEDPLAAELPTLSAPSRVSGRLPATQNSNQVPVDLMVEAPSAGAPRPSRTAQLVSRKHRRFDEEDELQQQDPPPKRVLRTQGSVALKKQELMSADNPQAIPQAIRILEGSSNSESVSARGDIKPSLIPARDRPRPPPVDDLCFHVKRAACQPNHFCDAERLLAPSEKPSDSKGTLRAFVLAESDENTSGSKEPAPECHWLRVRLPVTTTVFHHGSSKFVIVSQRTDNVPGCQIGANLALEFVEPAVASQFVQWMRTTPEEPALKELEEQDLDKRSQHIFAQVQKAHTNVIKRHPGTATDDSKIVESSDRGQNGPAMPWHAHTGAGARASPGVKRLRSSMKTDSGAVAVDDDDDVDRNKKRLQAQNSTPERPTRTRQRGGATSVASVLDLDAGEAPTPVLRWTEQNPGWDKDWHMSLVYLSETIYKQDITRLDEGEFLNDSIIGFYLQYLHKQLREKNKQVADRIFIYNSFFYEKLKPTKGRRIDYEKVKKWTNRVDLFRYDFIIVPVNENTHWWVAVICNAPSLLAGRRSASEGNGLATSGGGVEQTVEDGSACPSPASRGTPGSLPSQRVSPATANVTTDLSQMSLDKEQAISIEDEDSTPEPELKVVTLDSLGSAHSPACSYLKQYLTKELCERKKIEVEMPVSIGHTAKKIPTQDNYSDCGVYLLRYMEAMMEDPDVFIRGILHKEEPKWTVDAPALRTSIRELVFKLQREYQAREELEAKEKAGRKHAKEQAGVKQTGAAATAAAESVLTSPLPITSDDVIPSTEKASFEISIRDGSVPN